MSSNKGTSPAQPYRASRRHVRPGRGGAPTGVTSAPRDPVRGARATALGFALAVVAACGTVDDGANGTDPCEQTGCDPGASCVDGECVDATVECTDLDEDGYGPGCAAGADCDDTRSDVHAGASEICDDDIDNDCNFIIDDRDVCAPCTDVCAADEAYCFDDDIVTCLTGGRCTQFSTPTPCPGALACRNGTCVEVCVDADQDGFGVDCPGAAADDCDDTRGDIFPGAPERCDAADNDCDTIVDEGFVCDEPCESECELGDSVCSDDHAARRACASSPDGCTRFTGDIPCPENMACDAGECVESIRCIDLDGDEAGPGCESEDCRPLDASSYGGASEICDGVDNDCDGQVDESCGGCPDSSPDAPLSIGTGTSARSCGTPLYFDVSGFDRLVAISPSGPPALTVGDVRDGVFVPASPGRAFGDATSADVVGASLAQVVAPEGASVTVAATESSRCTDTLEPNDSPATGSPAGDLPFAHQGAICSDGGDYFRLFVPRGRVLSVALTVADTQSAGDLSLAITRAGTEESLGFSADIADDGRPASIYAFYRSDLGGDYGIAVRGARQVDVSYALVATLLPIDACEDDGFEDDDSFELAEPLESEGTRSGVICPGDFDYVLLEDALGSVDMTLSGDGGNLDAYLLSESARHVVYVANGDADVEVIRSSLSGQAPYVLMIFGRSSRDQASYTLTRHQ